MSTCDDESAVRRSDLKKGAGMRLQRCTVQTALLFALFITCLNAEPWMTGTVDGTSGGKYSTLKLDSFGNAHVVHFDPSSGTINYSFWDHSLNKWFSTVLDKGSGFCSLTLDSKQRPHISYPEGTNRIKYTYWDGSAWQKQVANIHATVINYFTSIGLDAEDKPSISFYEEIGVGEFRGRLRVVHWNGKYWEVRTADSDLGAGKFNSLAIDSNGNPEIAYGDVEYQNASLRYARWNGHSWDIDILEGAGQPGTNMWSVSLLLDKNDVPHIAYTDVRKNVIKYATKKGGKWVLTDIASISQVAYPDRNGLAVDDYGRVYISYFDNGTGVLRLTELDGDKRLSEVVDQGFAGLNSSLEIHEGWIWLTYSNEDGSRLKVARRRIEPPLVSSAQETLK
jgi:hypothetical protein